MKITYLGHAGLKVETAGATVLCDPWLSPEGAYQASWFQYPDNEHVLSPSLLRPAAILISHEHLDHVDPWFLARVPREVPVIIPRYPSTALRGKILSAGPREIIEVRPWEIMELVGGIKIFFVSEESPMNLDSAMVILDDEHVLLNLNDARLSPAQLRGIQAKLGRTVDVFALQGAGASWYPMCYEGSAERHKGISRQKRLAKFTYMARAIKVVQPLTVLPFAGPPCFLDPELFPYNAEIDDGIFPDQQQVADWLAGKGLNNVVVLLPNDAWDAARQRKEPDPKWEGFSLADRKGYLEDYAQRRRPQIEAVRARYPEPQSSLWPAFRDYGERLLTISPYFNRKIDMRIGFELVGPGGGSWSLDFRRGHEGVCDTMGDCGYRYRFASRWLPPIIAGAVPWEDFFLSLRFTASRHPDVYNDHLLGLLKFASAETLSAVEKFETTMNREERVTIQAEGQTYRVQRYCPHAGLDFQDLGEVLPGKVLRCLGHNYEFDLETGKCLNGNCKSLKSERDSSVRESSVREQ